LPVTNHLNPNVDSNDDQRCCLTLRLGGGGRPLVAPLVLCALFVMSKERTRGNNISQRPAKNSRAHPYSSTLHYANQYCKPVGDDDDDDVGGGGSGRSERGTQTNSKRSNQPAFRYQRVERLTGDYGRRRAGKKGEADVSFVADVNQDGAQQRRLLLTSSSWNALTGRSGSGFPRRSRTMNEICSFRFNSTATEVVGGGDWSCRPARANSCDCVDARRR